MKQTAILLCLGAGVLAWIVGAGCAQAPVRQVVEKAPDPKPVVTEEPAPLPVAQTPSADVTVCVTKPESLASIISKPEKQASLLPTPPTAQPVASGKMDAPPVSNSKAAPAKPDHVASVSVAAVADKKAAIENLEEKKSAALERWIKQTKLEVAPPAASVVNAPSKKKEASLPASVAKPAPKKPQPPIEFVENSVVKQAAPLPIIKTRMGHADDYTWICGQLQYWALHKTWRLRYAGLDEVDPYGGSVTLADDIRGSEVKDGQYVRVEGRLIDAAAKGIAPAYAVQGIHPLEK